MSQGVGPLRSAVDSQKSSEVLLTVHVKDIHCTKVCEGHTFCTRPGKVKIARQYL